MKQVLGVFKKVSGLILMGSCLAVMACSKTSNDSSQPAQVATVGSCAAGSVYNASYGCLPQAGCAVGYGMYNGQCVTATSVVPGQSCSAGYVYSGSYGCLAQAGCAVGYGMYNGQCIYVANNNTNTATSSCQGTCQVGYTQTTNGCLPQGACNTCYGYSNNWCYPAQINSYNGNTYPN